MNQELNQFPRQPERAGYEIHSSQLNDRVEPNIDDVAVYRVNPIGFDVENRSAKFV
jgi:hypothetical protein